MTNEYSSNDIMAMLGQTVAITKTNSENVSVVLTELQEQRGLINGLSRITNGVKADINGVKNDIMQLKLNEEVTTSQQEIIIESAQRRVSEILGRDPLEQQKYFRIFAKRIYSDSRHQAGLGSKISRTKKGDYQRVLDYMEAWYQVVGVKHSRIRQIEMLKHVELQENKDILHRNKQRKKGRKY